MTAAEIATSDMTIAEIIAETRRIMDETAALFREAAAIIEGPTA